MKTINIEVKDVKFLNDNGISVDSVLNATAMAIERIKSINSAGIDFKESFTNKGIKYILFAKILYYKKKKVYQLQVYGIGRIEASNSGRM